MAYQSVTAQEGGGSGQVPSLLAERARSECARSMRAVEASLGHSLEERRREFEGIRAVEDQSASIPKEVAGDPRKISGAARPSFLLVEAHDQNVLPQCAQ